MRRARSTSRRHRSSSRRSPTRTHTLGFVVLDLRELTFMSCAGMHAIVDDSRRARQTGGRLVLVRGDPGVYRLFAVTGSLDDVEIADLDRPPPLARPQRSLVSQSVLATG